MKKIYIYMLGFSSLFMVTNSLAQTTCEISPNCTILGYTEIVADCSNSSNAVKCPFDTSKVFCLEKSEDCYVGSILYSDRSCSKTVIVGKTAIAVVFSEEKRLAVALYSAASNLAWGKSADDIPVLTNCSSGTELSCGTDGKANTSAIIAYGRVNSVSYPAAEYCNSYTTAGTIAGNWFLPSLSELQSIYNVKGYVNTSLQLLDKPVLPDLNYHWSSTECKGNYPWALNFYSALTFSSGSSVNLLAVRAVMAF